MNIGGKTRGIREIKNYSQEFMAHEMGISQKTYSQLDNDLKKWDLDKINKAAELLEIDLFALLADKGNPMVFNNCKQEHFGYVYLSAQNYVSKLEEDNAYLKNKINELFDLIKSSK